MSESGTKSLRKPLRFWGWGYADEDLHPEEHAMIDMVTKMFVPEGLIELEPPRVEDFELPESRLTAVPEHLSGIISTTPYDRLVHSFGKSYADMIATLIEAGDASNIRDKAARYLGISNDAHALDALEWLGLFSNESINREKDSPFEVTSDLMMEKMTLGRNERDIVAMQHTFLVDYPEKEKEVIKSSMLVFGSPDSDTSVARTVAIPAAIAVRLILEGKINLQGVYRPVIPEIYEPVLDELEKNGIKLEEQFGLPLDENIKLP